MEKSTIIEHLKDLRKRLLWAIVAYLASAGISFAFASRIRDILRSFGGDIELVYISPSEALLTDIKVSLLAGFFVALPFILYQIWMFVAPGLHRQEKKYLVLLVFASLVLFLTGASFAFGVVLPFAMAFFQSFAGPGLVAMFTYDRYIQFVGTLTIIFGLVFQLPLIMVFLAYVGVVSPEGLRRQRKLALLLVFTVAALLTPPDPTSQILMAVPLIVLYEISIILTQIVVKRKRRAK